VTKSTRKPCLDCGIDCFWSAFDLQWSHMGWTGNGKEQPKPHQPNVEVGGVGSAVKATSTGNQGPGVQSTPPASAPLFGEES
jgi:hypothetical protein